MSIDAAHRSTLSLIGVVLDAVDDIVNSGRSHTRQSAHVTSMLMAIEEDIENHGGMPCEQESNWSNRLATWIEVLVEDHTNEGK